MLNKRLVELARRKPPERVHFPLRCPRVSLECQTLPAPRPATPDFPHTPGGPDVSRDRLPVEFAFLPNFEVQVDQPILDYVECAISRIAQIWEDDDDKELLYHLRVSSWSEYDRFGVGPKLVLPLALICTFSTEELFDTLRPHAIHFAKSVASTVWQQWGPLFSYTAASSYAPRLTDTVVGLICRLPPTFIARMPPDYIALLPVSCIETLPASCIETLPVSCIKSLSPSCIESLSSCCIQTLPLSCIARLSRSCIDGLTLDPLTQMQLHLIHFHHSVDSFSLSVVAPLVPWLPAPVVTFGFRFLLAWGFWSVSYSLFKLIHNLEIP